MESLLAATVTLDSDLCSECVIELLAKTTNLSKILNTQKIFLVVLFMRVFYGHVGTLVFTTLLNIVVDGNST